MTPDQFAAARAAIDDSDESLAESLGVTAGDVRAWALTDKRLPVDERIGQWLKKHENKIDAVKTIVGIIKP